MARKHTGGRRPANVVVPFDAAELLPLLFRGVGGRFCDEISSACASGPVPFEREIDPRAYSCPDSFRGDYLLATLLSKYDDEESSEAKKQAAFEKFLQSESSCASTNRRFARFVGGPLSRGVTVEAVLFTASRKISNLLGVLDLDEVAKGFGWGPGASTRLSRRQSDAWYKFQGNPETTPNNVVFADAVFQHSPLWLREVDSVSEEASHPYRIVEANHVITVPKNAKIDRIIAIEPDLNLYVQKGFGAVIRNRLLKAGVNLNDQTINQCLARVGSCDGSLATIDLSAASDTVSRAIVEQLLPPDWLSALEQCRSPKGVLPSGETIIYQKFSSMGNGFTFELESLIFWALASALLDLMGERDRRISVYGDDIIIPTYAVEPFIGLLSFCGFKTNERKSFWDGPFRESCGKHYFRGVDVTPFFLRKKPRRLSDVFLLHNNVVRWCNKGAYRWSGHRNALEDFCSSLRRIVPRNWRKPRIPLGYGDGAFVGSFDECTPSRAPRGYSGWRAEVLTEPRLRSDRGGAGRLLKSLYQLESRPDPVREHVGRTAPLSDGTGLGFPRVLLLDDRVHSFWLQSRRPSRPYYAFVPNGVGYEVVNMAGLGSSDDCKLGGLGVLPRGTEFSFLGGERVLASFLKQEVSSYDVPTSEWARVTKILVPQWAELGPWL